MAFKLSKHADIRMQQRGFHELDLELVQEYGTPKSEGILMRKRDVLEAIQAEKAQAEQKIRRLERLNDVFVVIPDDTVATLYRTGQRKQRHLLKREAKQ